MFKKYLKQRKQKAELELTSQQLENDYKTLLAMQVKMANSELFKFFVDYFEAKIEIERDKLEFLNFDKNKEEVMFSQAKIQVMRDFIGDVIEGEQAAKYNNEMTSEGIT